MADAPVAVFGDVHGCSKKLRALINKIRAKYPDAELVSVGDLIDRGPDSKGVIEICIQEGVVACLGNHEDWLLDLIQTGNIRPVFGHVWGVTPTLKSYGCNYVFRSDTEKENAMKCLLRRMPEAHKDYIRSMQLCLRVDVDGKRYWVSHSGITINSATNAKVRLREAGTPFTDENIISDLAKHSDHVFYFTKQNFGTRVTGSTPYKFDTGTQIFGHQIVQSPIMSSDYIALDTGCGTTQPHQLTAVVLPHGDIIQVP